MPVLDDEFLSTLFLETADTFEIPPSGVDEILRRANGDVVGPATDDVEQYTFDVDPTGVRPTGRSLGTTIRAHRLLSVAACLIVVVAVTGVGLALGRHGPAPVSSRQLAVAPTQKAVTHGTERTAAGGLPTSTKSAASPASGVQGDSEAAGSSTFSAARSPSSAAANAADSQSSKIEQTGSLSLRVHRGALASTIAKLTALAASNDGFVANSQTNSTALVPDTEPTGSITLQVPVASFTTVIKEAQALGKSLQLSTKATDVTGQYVNLQSQITALQASLQQYLTIMTKAQTISDILAVQSQIQNLQSQIQQLQGQLGVLTNETSYSTLAITLHEPAPVHHHHRGPQRASGFDRAWNDSVHGFVDAAADVVGFVGPALFVILVAGVVVVAGRLSWRRWQRHNL